MVGQRGNGGASNDVGRLPQVDTRSRGQVAPNAGGRIAVRSMPLPIVEPKAGNADGMSARRSAGLEFITPRVLDLALAPRPGVINLDLVNRPRRPPEGQKVPRDLPNLELNVRLGRDCSSVCEKMPTSCILPLMPPAGRCGMAAIMKQPYIRRGLNPGRLTARERDDYLLEAERCRNVRTGCGAVLAVFKNIPIELVSRIRFDERRCLLAYTLVSLRGIGKSRIHDLAAVRDSTSGRIFLIPRRTRFQMAALP